MKLTLRLTLILIVLFTATLACSLGGGIDPNAASGSVLFQDDFSKKSGGWDEVNANEGATEYGDGVYRIFVNEINYYIWANPRDMTFADAIIDVDITKVGGPDANDMGIICRYTDEENFYFLVVGSDGYYSINKLVAGEEALVGMEELGFNDTAINTGNATNHLQASCVGSTLTLSANGTQLISVTDSDLTEGNVGLMAGTWETAGADINFDNFAITKP